MITTVQSSGVRKLLAGTRERCPDKLVWEFWRGGVWNLVSPIHFRRLHCILCLHPTHTCDRNLLICCGIL